MKNNYGKPPVQEVVCEIVFETKTKIDYQLTYNYFLAIKESYPKVLQKNSIGFKNNITQNGLSQEIDISPRVNYLNESGDSVIQLIDGMLVFNFLKYSSWGVLKPQLMQGIGKLASVVDSLVIKRIGLRYINKIEISGDSIRMEDYYRYYPTLPENANDIHNSFKMDIVIPFDKQQHRMRLQFYSGNSGRKGIHMQYLDIDVVSTATEILADKLDESLENAHRSIEETFEACITDKLRTIFEVQKQ